MQDHQSLGGQEAQPQVGRHRRLGGVLRGPLQDVELGLLEHVGGINPSLEPPVQPHLDHPAQAVAMTVEEFRQLMLIGPHAGTCDLTRPLRVCHRFVSPFIILTARRLAVFTDDRNDRRLRHRPPISCARLSGSGRFFWLCRSRKASKRPHSRNWLVYLGRVVAGL